MALKGTLRDFAISDILQLIGQQQKTGTLHLRSKTEEVRVTFREGSIISAGKYLGKKRDPIGYALVRAGILNELELEQGLEIQRKSSQALGTVLLEEQLVTEMQLRRMLQLQTTETLYQLFHWKSGKYEFKQGEIEDGPVELAPTRVEAIVMEGFRRIDEWPALRTLIPNDDSTFERLRPFSDESQGAGDDSNKGLTPEGVIYSLINGERSARRLAELTSLGLFETFQALANLLKDGFIRSVEPTIPSYKVPPHLLVSASNRFAQIAAIGVSGAIVAWGAGLARGGSLAKKPSPTSSYSDPAGQRFLSQAQLARIGAAIGLFRLENGEVPEKLEALVKAGLLNGDDLKYPWGEIYYYRKIAPLEFVLLPPLR